MARLYILLALSIPLATLPVLAADGQDEPVEDGAMQTHVHGVTAQEGAELPALVGSMEADDLLEDARIEAEAPAG